MDAAVGPADVAFWMREELIRRGAELYQSDAVNWIAEDFGDEFVYENENGNLAIDQKVLKAFRDLTKDTVVWHKSWKAWELRQPDDEPGRRGQAY